jgi:hypothetical protein
MSVWTIRLARNAQLELEDGIGDRARFDQLCPRDAELRERDLQSRIVHRRDRNRFVGGELVLQHCAHTFVVGERRRLCVRQADGARHAHARREQRRHEDDDSLHFFSFFTSVMPHFGHLPGDALVTSGCIGQT